MDSTTLRQDSQTLLSELGLDSLSDVVLLALQCVRSGNYQQALDLCRAGSEKFGGDAAVKVVSAMAELGLGHAANAQSLLSNVYEERPQHLVGLYTSAWMHAELGNRAGAIEDLLRVTRTFPDYPGALGMLSSLLMPGPSYREVLSYIHLALRPTSYLEIGVETGATLRLAQTAKHIVGVDPNLASLRRDELSPQTQLYAVTSDEFFETQTLSKVFGGQPLQLAFIDGMHRFEFALRDFCNVELWSNPQTVVVVHDVLPILPIVAERERQTKFWVGDVWKALWLLAELRKDLTVTVIPTPPSGLAVFRGLNRAHRHDSVQWSRAIERYAGLSCPIEEPGIWPSQLRVTENTKRGWHDALGISENSS